MRRVGFLGLGTMGGNMARRLLGAGFEVRVYNRTASRAEALRPAGASVKSTPREAAEGAEVVIAMLADDGASRSAWLGEQGALSGVAPGTVLIESSTLSTGWVQELARRSASQGCPLLDAPVTGSEPQAQSGELLFLVGGDSGVFESVRDVLAPMSRAAIYLGPNGSGSLMKLINNFLCGVQAASLAEAMVMIERSGLNRAQALEVLTSGAPGSPLLRTLAARMVESDYRPRFSVQLMLKDLSYAGAEARRLDVSTETVEAGRKTFESATRDGWGDRDIAAIVEPIRKTKRTG